MKYRLNKLPVKTTNGFQINDVEVDLKLPSFCKECNFQIQGDISLLDIKKEIVSKTITSKIGLTIPQYYEIHITIPKNVKIEEPISMTYDFKKEDALYTSIHFCFEENSSCNFVISIHSKDEYPHFSHIMEHTVSKRGSCGNITFMNLLNSSSTSFYAIENDVLERAEIAHSIFDFNGKMRLYNIYSNLLEQSSKNRIHTLYIGKKNSLLDFNYYAKNIGKESNNQINIEGVLNDCSHKNFRGTIDFMKGCSNSIGEESENCVLLTDTCRSRSLPQLLCEEENVVGAHGVSSGKVSEDKLFYLMSRGYSKKEAEKLIVLGNFMNIIHSIPAEEVQNQVLEQIEKEI